MAGKGNWSHKHATYNEMARRARVVTGIPYDTLRRSFQAFLFVMKEMIEGGERVDLYRFGSFRYVARNLGGKRRVVIKFTPSKEMRHRLLKIDPETVPLVQRKSGGKTWADAIKKTAA